MKKERLFGNEAKWEGGEHPDEGAERLEKFRVVVMEQVGTNGIACKASHKSDKSSFTLLCGQPFHQTASQNKWRFGM